MRSPREQEDFLKHGRFGETTDLSLSRRFVFSFCGLLAGDTALLITLLPGGSTWVAEVFILYGIFSFVGWAMIGLPVALGVSPRFLCRLSWLARLLIGVSLGPLALLAIFVILAAREGTPEKFSLAHTGAFWPMSMLVSATSFTVYTALLRRQLRLQ